MNVRSFINRQLNKVITRAYGSGSFSRIAEDLVISQALSIIGEKKNISYLDIGAGMTHQEIVQVTTVDALAEKHSPRHIPGGFKSEVQHPSFNG